MPESRLTKSLSPFLISDQGTLIDQEATVSTFPTTLHLTSGTTTPFHVWDAILRLYSAGSLTYASDKLVAISGIARELAPFIGGRYLAGLWEVQMARQLLWIASPERISYDTSACASSRPYRSPSWSWATTDQPLKTAMQWDYRGVRNKRDFLIDILNVDVVPAQGSDSFGQVSRASITVKGRLIEASLRTEKDARGARSEEDDADKYSIVLDGQVLNEVTVFEDRAINKLEEEKYCVPISVSISVPEVSLDRRTLVYGLLLERSEEPDKFRRVGAFMAPKGELFLIDPSTPSNASTQEEGAFDWRNCTQWHGEGGKSFGRDIFTLV